MGLFHVRLPDGSVLTDISSADDGTLSSTKKELPEQPSWLTRAHGNIQLQEFREGHRKFEGFELVERFSQVLALRYFEDTLAPGVHTSCVVCRPEPGEVPLYYAAVHRYPSGRRSAQRREVVVSAKGHTMEGAVRNLISTWLEFIKYEMEAGAAATSGSPFGKVPVARNDLNSNAPVTQESIEDLLQRSIDAFKKKTP